MPPYRCRSHDRSDCRDAVCRRQAERAGLVEPRVSKPRARSSAGAAETTAGAPSRSREAAARARAGELWVGPTTVGYGAHGQTRGSTAHLPGGVCKHSGENPDATGLYEGWGRIVGMPSAIDELINGNPVAATDESGLVAVRLCQLCRSQLH